MEITISDLKIDKISRLAAATGGSRKAELSEGMGHEVQRLTVFHLKQIAATRHTTASKLGAAPSNFWAPAVEKVASSSALSAESESATLTINHPGISRALRDITIKPIEAKSLAIPVRAIAYAHRPAELWDSLHLFIPKGRRYIAMRSGKKITVLYLLVRSITQKQDRTLLPSAENLHRAAALGALKFIKSL